MKHYPHIPRVHDFIGRQCIGFEKYDGSNIRCEWSKKKGWYQFALRGGGMIDRRDAKFGTAITIFEKEYGEPLIKAIYDYKPFAPYRERGIMAFCEFYGPYSFAGLHDDEYLRRHNCLPDDESNQPMQVMLFDINIFKKGIVGPEDFLASCGHLKTPAVLYRGVLDKAFIEQVRNGTLVEGHNVLGVPEGVVCKGGSGWDHSLWMAKVKTTAYINRLKEVFGVGWEIHGE